jgi:cytoskeletal protein RodZ
VKSRKIGRSRFKDFAVAHLFDNHPDDVDYQAPQEEPPRRRWVKTAVAAALLAVIGMSSAVLWYAYGGSVPALPSFASATGQPAAPAVVADKPVGLKDLQALQQQIAASAQSTTQLLATQQAEIKRLADQVAVLAAKVDLLERPTASAQASLPAAQPVAPAARKKPAAPKPAAAISVGGAPLPQR